VGQENLNKESNYAAFSNSTSVTAYVNNLGTVNETLSTYYVKDANGNTYQYNYPSPNVTIAPNTNLPITFKIGASCSSCVLTGTAFTFTSGYQYTVLMITSRNNQFTFTVTR